MGSNIQDNAVHPLRPSRPVSIGKDVTVGHGAIIHGCTVEDRCLIGMGAILLNGCVIGEGSLVAAGALVTQNAVIPPGQPGDGLSRQGHPSPPAGGDRRLSCTPQRHTGACPPAAASGRRRVRGGVRMTKTRS